MKKWTVMVYLAGDNNLSEDMVTTLKSLKVVGDTNDKINLVARYDSVYPPVPTGYYVFDCQKATTTLFGSMVKNENERITSLSASDVGKPIKDFVDFAESKFGKDSNYILILSGHGDAFRGKTFLYDENPLGSLSLGDLKKTLEYIKTKLGKNLAILGFDSCAMNLLEINYELKDVADYLVSSEGFTPKSGWAYEKVLEKLVSEADTITVEDVAKEFVIEFARFNEDYTLGGRSIEMSVTRLKEVESVFTVFNELVTELLNIFPSIKELDILNEKEVFVLNHFVKLILYSHWKAQTFFYEQNIDLFDFCNILKEQCDELLENILEFRSGSDESVNTNALTIKLGLVSNKCKAVLDSNPIEANGDGKYVVHNSFAGPEFQFAKGTSLFFPWSHLSFLISKEIYQNLLKDASGKNKWLDFLERFTFVTARFPEGASNKFSERFVSSNNWRTGTPYRGDMDTIKRYFSYFKNHWTDWRVKHLNQ